MRKMYIHLNICAIYPTICFSFVYDQLLPFQM